MPSSTFSIRPTTELDSIGIDITVDDVLFNLVTKDEVLHSIVGEELSGGAFFHLLH